MAGEVTFAELMQSPVITRVVNRIPTPLTFFQNLTGTLAGSSESIPTQSIRGRDAGWDIFDRTRTFAHGRAPQHGPDRVSEKPIAHQTAMLMRAHESMLIMDEDVYKTRPLGAQIGSTVDIRGQQHIRRQISYLLQRFRNQREWIISRMFRGGFGVTQTGQQWKLVELNTGDATQISVDFGIPTDNTARMPLGTGSNILTDWSQSAADIAGQLHKINQAYTRIHGRALKHVIINSTVLGWLHKNTGLQALAGTSRRTFDTQSHPSMVNAEGIQHAGFSVVFHGIPWVTFHVYDGVLSTEGDTDGISTTDMSLLVPDSRAIFLPELDDQWFGMIEGSEVIAENVIASGREVFGFNNWATRVIDPPGWELKMVDNYLPILYVPRCVGYGDVGA